MKNTVRKHSKTVLRFAVVGFAVTAIFVVYEVLFDPTGHSFTAGLLCLVLCPPSLLSVPIIDAEIGTGGYYFVFSTVALLNAALYGFIATTVLHLRGRSAIRRAAD